MALTEQVRRAAIKAGLMGMNGTSVATHKLEAFADYLLDEENEACAKVIESDPSYDWHKFACEAASSIRARRKQ